MERDNPKTPRKDIRNESRPVPQEHNFRAGAPLEIRAILSVEASTWVNAFCRGDRARNCSWTPGLTGSQLATLRAGRRAGCAQPGAEVFLASKKRVLDDHVGACSGQSSVKLSRCPGSGTRASSPAFRAADRAPNSRDRCDHISTAEPVISCRPTVALKRSTIFGLACSPYPPGAYHEHADAVRRLLAKLTRGSLDRRSLAHSGGMSS